MRHNHEDATGNHLRNLLWLRNNIGAIARKISLAWMFVVLPGLAAWAEEIRIPMPALTGDYTYGVASAPIAFDVGSCLATVAEVKVEITGTHEAGWWDENYFGMDLQGPKDGNLGFYLNRTDLYQSWYTTVHFTNNGQFTNTLTFEPSFPLRNTNGYVCLFDGTNNLVGWTGHEVTTDGGRFITNPVISLSSVTLIVEAQRLLKINSVSKDGRLSWSRVPGQSSVRIESALQLTGPWSPVATNDSSTTSCIVPVPTPGMNVFYRIIPLP